MKKLLCVALCLCACVASYAADEISIIGKVLSAVNKQDLTEAMVYRLDAPDGNVVDSIQANQGMRYDGHETVRTSNFYFKVPKADSTYVFRVSCPSYKTVEFTYQLEKPGKRETYRNIPYVYLERAPLELKEVTVTQSKIKFYNKGDTVVFNADAFQLAEGSMLDALIAQLPGVELSSDGQIKVNGEFVESLLLNGKEFLDGNNKLMLDNIAAYTVKNVEVYEGESLQAKREGNTMAPKQLTMDVRLKREYMMGWIANLTGGYGTENRYLGKVFAQWFNQTTRVSIIGNANNLNDNREPGKNDSWTPEQAPNGTRSYHGATIEYNYETQGERQRMLRGNFTYNGSSDNTVTTTSRTNFLPGGDTYDRSFARNRNRETRLATMQAFWMRNNAFHFGTAVNGNYNHSRNNGSGISGTFNRDPENISAEILEAIYGTAAPGVLESVLNRQQNRTDGWSKTLNGSINPYMGIKIPGTSDQLGLSLNLSYNSLRNELWRDNTINYGANPDPAYRLRQFTDGTPNHNLALGGNLYYQASFGKVHLFADYSFSHQNKVKDSYMYALDRLADMGVYGTLPEGYLATLDPANSYASRTIENKHSIQPQFYAGLQPSETTRLTLRLGPKVELLHRSLDYFRADRPHTVHKTNVAMTIQSIWDGMVEYHFGKYGEGRNTSYRNAVRYSYRLTPKLPELTDLIDITDDSDPLNIYVGTPGLKTEIEHRHLARWAYKPQSHTLTSTFYASAYTGSNVLVRGYTYDTTTGVRVNRMYNVDGNHGWAVEEQVNWQFGSTKQFTLDTHTDLSYATMTDMIGIDLGEPARTKVHNRQLSQRLKLGWKIGKQSLQLRADGMNRHTESSQAGFNTINANHFNYGISGIFSLPAGFGISTDFTCYTRRGYGMDELDTTDPIWNLRATYCPVRHSRWVFTLDGFDLLHSLSNVNYAVSASGRTVSYTNALPRYVLLTVQYRLSIQPKKR